MGCGLYGVDSVSAPGVWESEVWHVCSWCDVVQMAFCGCGLVSFTLHVQLEGESEENIGAGTRPVCLCVTGCRDRFPSIVVVESSHTCL